MGKPLGSPPGKAGRKMLFSVHKNKIEAKRKRDLAHRVVADAERMIKTHDIRAFALVGIAADGAGHAYWDSGAILPLWAFPETIYAILRKDVEISGVAEDWKPNLTLRGGD